MYVCVCVRSTNNNNTKYTIKQQSELINLAENVN